MGSAKLQCGDDWLGGLAIDVYSMRVFYGDPPMYDDVYIGSNWSVGCLFFLLLFLHSG